jgi:hypothetical protein
MQAFLHNIDTWRCDEKLEIDSNLTKISFHSDYQEEPICDDWWRLSLRALTPNVVYEGSPNISQSDLLELEFYRRAENWKYETSSFSSITKKMRHQDYLKIIEMGVNVLPFILRSLMKEPDHWFVALKSITNEDPIPYGASFQDSVNGWLAWGRERDLI